MKTRIAKVCFLAPFTGEAETHIWGEERPSGVSVDASEVKWRYPFAHGAKGCDLKIDSNAWWATSVTKIVLLDSIFYVVQQWSNHSVLQIGVRISEILCVHTTDGGGSSLWCFIWKHCTFPWTLPRIFPLSFRKDLVEYQKTCEDLRERLKHKESLLAASASSRVGGLCLKCAQHEAVLSQTHSNVHIQTIETLTK